MSQDIIEVIDIRKIKPDPHQPRQDFDPIYLRQLKKSIEKKGILNPLIVEVQDDGYFLLIDGERRYRASIQLELKKVPVRIYEPMNELDRLMLRFHLQENAKPWNMIEKAKAVKTLTDKHKLDSTQLAEMLNLTHAQLRHYKLVLVLGKETQQAIAERRIPSSYAASIGDISVSLKGLGLAQYTEKLEESLVDKVERGVITKRSELRAFRQSLSKGGKAIVENIIQIRDYSADKALMDSKSVNLHAYNRLLSNMSWIEVNLNKAIENSLFEMCEPIGLNQFKRAYKKIGRFIDLAPALVKE